MNAPAKLSEPRLFWLLSQAHRRVMARVDAELVDLDLTAVQSGALFSFKPGESLSVGELGETLKLAQSAASGLAQRMEAAGLIVRAPDPQDGRAVRLKLTDLGIKRREEAVKRARAGNAQLSEGFTPTELALIARWLRHAAGVVEKEKVQ